MPEEPVQLTLEAQDALWHLKLARALLDHSRDMATIMLVDQAIVSLSGSDASISVRNLR